MKNCCLAPSLPLPLLHSSVCVIAISSASYLIVTVSRARDAPLVARAVPTRSLAPPRSVLALAPCSRLPARARSESRTQRDRDRLPRSRLDVGGTQGALALRCTCPRRYTRCMRTAVPRAHTAGHRPPPTGAATRTARRSNQGPAIRPPPCHPGDGEGEERGKGKGEGKER